MVGKQTIAIIVASGIGTLACAGFVYLYQQGVLPRFDSAKESPGQATGPSGPEKQTALSPEAQPAGKPKPEASSTAQPPAEPTAVPSFDVVVIDPSGEGVIAGRAAPGWQVNVQSGGASVAVGVEGAGTGVSLGCTTVVGSSVGAPPHDASSSEMKISM